MKRHVFIALAVVAMLGTVVAFLPAADKTSDRWGGMSGTAGTSGAGGGAMGKSVTLPGYAVNVAWFLMQPAGTMSAGGGTMSADMFSGMPSPEDNNPIAIMVTDMSQLMSAMGGTSGAGGGASGWGNTSGMSGSAGSFSGSAGTSGASGGASGYGNTSGMSSGAGTSGTGYTGGAAPRHMMGRMVLLISDRNSSDSKDALKNIKGMMGKEVRVTGQYVQREGIHAIIVSKAEQGSGTGGGGGASGYGGTSGMSGTSGSFSGGASDK